MGRRNYYLWENGERPTCRPARVPEFQRRDKPWRRGKGVESTQGDTPSLQVKKYTKLISPQAACLASPRLRQTGRQRTEFHRVNQRLCDRGKGCALGPKGRMQRSTARGKTMALSNLSATNECRRVGFSAVRGPLHDPRSISFFVLFVTFVACPERVRHRSPKASSNGPDVVYRRFQLRGILVLYPGIQSTARLKLKKKFSARKAEYFSFF
jgi:hypothetical protein